jgi:hypothetical protein
MLEFDNKELKVTALVLRGDSRPTRSRRSIGSGGESSSTLTSVAGNAVHAFSKRKTSYLIVLHSVGGLVSLMFTHLMLSFKCRMADCYALYTIIHFSLLYIRT